MYDPLPSVCLRFRFPLTRLAACISALTVANEHASIVNGAADIRIPLDTLAHVHQALSIAEALLPLADHGAEVYGHDQRIHLHSLVGILHCYAKSFGTSDYRAHCWVSVARFPDDTAPLTFLATTSPAPEVQTITKRSWFFPCQYASPGLIQIHRAHPATVREQVASVLVSYECAWCPRLRDLDHWELLQWGRDDDD